MALLRDLFLDHTCIDVPALLCLAQGQWPALQYLSLAENHIDTTGVSYLVSGNWPLLDTLILSSKVLDDEAYLLLGIREKDRRMITQLQDFGVNPCRQLEIFSSGLPQFPYLQIQIDFR